MGLLPSSEELIAHTLQTRQKTHGDFYQQASTSMDILNAMEASRNWSTLTPDQKEALLLIAVKLGRILTGSSFEPDHWHDIAGYAQLVENRLNGKPSNGVVPKVDETRSPTPEEMALKRKFYEMDKPNKADPPWHIT